jgi:hypothetical protein
VVKYRFGDNAELMGRGPGPRALKRRLGDCTRPEGRWSTEKLDRGRAVSNKEIGQRLALATNTVKGHVHNILEKLALHTRLQIAAYARSGGPIGPVPPT